MCIFHVDGIWTSTRGDQAHVDRSERGSKTRFSCGRHKWMTPMLSLGGEHCKTCDNQFLADNASLRTKRQTEEQWKRELGVQNSILWWDENFLIKNSSKLLEKPKTVQRKSYRNNKQHRVQAAHKTPAGTVNNLILLITYIHTCMHGLQTLMYSYLDYMHRGRPYALGRKGIWDSVTVWTFLVTSCFEFSELGILTTLITMYRYLYRDQPDNAR